jgi:hypothetical protein
MYRSLKSIILGAALYASAVCGLAWGEVLQYEPATSSLSGTLVMERHYGPPNYGENPTTDSVLMVPILVLDAPVSVKGNIQKPGERIGLDSKSFSNVGRVQLVFSTPGRSLRRFVGQHVTATGKLFEKIAGENYTDDHAHAPQADRRIRRYRCCQLA